MSGTRRNDHIAKGALMRTASLDEIKSHIGGSVGTSSWVLVDQDMINRFADVTGDRQFIHVDEALAKQTPFGGTVAHGLLTLSLLPVMAYEVMPRPEGAKLAANYGYNKVRFVAPVRAGKRIRGHFKLVDYSEAKPGRWQQITEVTVEIEGEDKPALTAEWIGHTFM
jgi:acyl dehydratase